MEGRFVESTYGDGDDHRILNIILIITAAAFIDFSILRNRDVKYPDHSLL